jgi:hypothetical protein
MMGPASETRHNSWRERTQQAPHTDAGVFDYLVSRASKDGGVVIPGALAVLTLITSSVFETCCTVRSDGLSPFNTRPA